MKLLVAEDDPKLLKSLVHILEHNRFSVDGVSNGEDALEYGQTGEYDGLILDIMMPGLDGLQVLQTLRRNGIKTPALFLTARTEISQRVEGLDAGADDYLPKPFSTAELLARIRAMLRRKDTYLPDLLAIGSVILNRSTYQLVFQEKIQTLSGKEFQILEMMMQAPGTIIPTDRLSPISGDGIRMSTPALYGSTSLICARKSAPLERPWRSALYATPAMYWRSSRDWRSAQEIHMHQHHLHFRRVFHHPFSAFSSYPGPDEPDFGHAHRYHRSKQRFFPRV